LPESLPDPAVKPILVTVFAKDSYGGCFQTVGLSMRLRREALEERTTERCVAMNGAALVVGKPVTRALRESPRWNQGPVRGGTEMYPGPRERIFARWNQATKI